VKFTVGRLSLVAVQSFVPPLFKLPTRAPELFEALYGQLIESYPIGSDDMLLTGGGSYSDVRATIKSNDTMQVDVGSTAFHVQLFDAKGRVCFEELTTKCQATLQGIFPAIIFVDSVIHLHCWLECDGGGEGVSAELLARGKAALGKIKAAKLAKDFSFRVELGTDDAALDLVVELEKSKRPEGHLYAHAEFSFGEEYSQKRLCEQIDVAFSRTEALLRDLGYDGALQ
jgi:hypothetical protein